VDPGAAFLSPSPPSPVRSPPISWVAALPLWIPAFIAGAIAAWAHRRIRILHVCTVRAVVEQRRTDGV